MEIDRFEIDVEGRVTRGRMIEGDADRPLLVCLHGGSYTSAYFDLPGHSLLRIAASNGISAVALDRPCYGSSDGIEGPTSFAANAEVLDLVISSLMESATIPCSGVVLIGHSIGGAIALMIASRSPSWELLGVSATGIGDVLAPGVAEAWESMPPGEPVVFTLEERRQFMYGPDHSFVEDMLATAEASTAPIPLEELHEAVGGWVERSPRVIAEVAVPAQYLLAEHDGLWAATPETVAQFAAGFTAAPFVEAKLFRGAGHNIDHHLLGASLHHEQIAFALRCAQERAAAAV